MKIIVVDCDRMILDFVAEVLAYSVNREVLAFEGAGDALCHLDEMGADIVVCSMELPGSEGADLVARVKEGKGDRVCIAMSSFAAHEKSAAELGADGFLAKPFGVSELFELVHRFVVCAERSGNAEEAFLRECPAAGDVRQEKRMEAPAKKISEDDPGDDSVENPGVSDPPGAQNVI